MTFLSLGLTPSITDGLEYPQPTQIQSEAIPAILKGKDVIARANTGSGKTAAYLLPLIQILSQSSNVKRKGNQVRTLILVPTRELAIQVAKNVNIYASNLLPKIKTVAAYGGISINPQMLALRGGTDILIATPGRLIDLIKHNAIKLDNTTHIVLDEADRLLSLGFSDELTSILSLLPNKKQSLLFSATYDDDVKLLAEKLLISPIRINIQKEQNKAQICQRVFEVNKEQKTQLLIKLIKDHSWPQILIFVNAKVSCEHLKKKLLKAGLNAQVFHGDKSQGNRNQVIEKFSQHQLPILIATDIAARGLDIQDLPVVINYDLPRSPNDYIHRIGRTGRAGKHGIAISLINHDEYHHFKIIEKKNKFKLVREHYQEFIPSVSE